MPLTGIETYKTKLQKNNRLIIPRQIRWRHKIESGELLRVTISPQQSDFFQKEEFFAKTSTDIRLTVPKLTIQIIEEREGRKLTSQVVEVTISPAPPAKQATVEPEDTQANILEKIKDIRKSMNAN